MPVDYKFRNRIKVRTTDSKLAIDDWEWKLFEQGNRRIALSTGSPGEAIINAETLILEGGLYPTFHSALIQARRWRQWLSVYFAQVGFSVEMGDDREELCKPTEKHRLDSRTQPGFTDETMIYDDRIGLYVLPAEPSSIFFYGWGCGEERISVGQARKPLQTIAVRNQGLWDDKLSLAYELFHASLAESNVEARYILAITAVETLIARENRSSEVVDVIDQLISVVNSELDEINPQVAEEVIKLLREDKKQSISAIGRKLTQRLKGDYDGLTPNRFFSHAYGIRSQLAHGELRTAYRLDAETLDRQMRELSRFVLDLLAAWTPEHSIEAPESPSPSNPETEQHS